MKNDEQMYKSVLSRRDAYRERRNKRIRTIRRTVPVFACFCFAVVLGLGYWKQRSALPDIPVQPETTKTAVTGTEPAQTSSVLTDDTKPVPAVPPSGTTAAEQTAETNIPRYTQTVTAPADTADGETEAQKPETQAPVTVPPVISTVYDTEPPVITTAESPQTTDTEPIPPEEPIGVDAQPVPFADIHVAAEAVNSGDVSAYTGEERHAYRGMFQRMKKDGFLYQVTETDAVTLRDDLPVYLFPETLREDAGIGYYVTYREKNYHITFCYADDITAARTDGIADYLQKRMGRRSDKTVTVSGTNVSLFFADNGQTYAGALIDNDHYYTVNTAASEDEMIEFLESFRYDRFSLT